MSLKRKTAEVIKTNLTIQSQGEKIKFEVDYHNRNNSDLVALTNDPDKTSVDVVLFLVAAWDAEYSLDAEGIKLLEDERPGTLMAIMEGYYEARSTQRVKN